MLGKITQRAHQILEYTETTTGNRGNHQSRRVNRKLKRSEHVVQQICTIKNALQELEDAQQASTSSSVDQHARLETARNIIRDHNQHISTQLPRPPMAWVAHLTRGMMLQ